ncbi:MAG: FAD-binding oxidoreductase [Deltaproteobacteria bacterium]|nr:FAD-binding oxidoreductase [Deltaproteobacteria bacterium]
MKITVVGAGVVGLSTALALEEAGHEVRVVAAARGDATTSAVAGAVWFPYRAGPPHKVAAWALRTRGWLEQIAQDDPGAGVDVLVGYEVDEAAGTAIPWWAAGIAVERVPAPIAGGPLAWKFSAPRVEPSRFLPWLAARLRARFEERVVVDLAAEAGDLIINCTGLGARALTGDAALVPLLGQIAIAAPGDADLGVSITDERDPDGIFYIIPRRDELVLGGCSLAWPADTTFATDAAITDRIVARARTLGIAVGEVRHTRVGLRPYRLEVRLERDAADPRIIHNYGHGGAGFTLSRGCAEDVVALIATD